MIGDVYWSSQLNKHVQKSNMQSLKINYYDFIFDLFVFSSRLSGWELNKEKKN